MSDYENSLINIYILHAGLEDNTEVHCDAILLSIQMLSYGQGVLAAAGRGCPMQTITTAVCNLNKVFTEQKLKTDSYRLTDGLKLALS